MLEGKEKKTNMHTKLSTNIHEIKKKKEMQNRNRLNKKKRMGMMLIKRETTN